MVKDTTVEIASWWTALSFGQKALRALFLAFTFSLALAAKLQGWTEVPSRLTEVEVTVAAIEVEVVRLQKGEKRAEYLFCVDLADRQLITKTPQDCFQDYSQ